MGEMHIVQQGECLTAIAAEYGFAEIKQIYEAPENAELRKLRPDPHVLLPGDRIFIPERKEKWVSLATGQRHTLAVKLPKRKLHVKLQLAPGESLMGEPFELKVGGRTITGTVGTNNSIEATLPYDQSVAMLVLPKRNLSLRLGIGHLDPIRDGSSGEPIPTGVQARLHNLGFLAGVPTGTIDDATTAAIRQFQATTLARTTPDGVLDEETLNKLAEEHGC